MRIRRWKREIRMYRMRIRRLEIIKLTVFNGEVAESESMRFPCFFSSQIVISLSQRFTFVATSLTLTTFHVVNIQTKRNNRIIQNHIPLVLNRLDFVQPQKLPIDIPEKNETKVMY